MADGQQKVGDLCLLRLQLRAPMWGKRGLKTTRPVAGTRKRAVAGGVLSA
jgi:hypothetical protein